MAGKKGQLGGLFVELGFKGQPLLKGLDVAAGKFSLIKHAATEAAKMIDNAISGVASGAAELNKIQTMTGFTPTQIRQWREWERINKVTEGTVANTYANIAKMQELMSRTQDFSQLPLGYQMYQISPFQTPEEIVRQFKARATQEGMSPLQQQVMLQQMGISPEFIALLDGVQSQVNDATRATEKETKALTDLDRSITTFKQTLDNVWEKWIGQTATDLWTPMVKGATKAVELPVTGGEGLKDLRLKFNKWYAEQNVKRLESESVLEKTFPDLKKSKVWNDLKNFQIQNAKEFQQKVNEEIRTNSQKKTPASKSAPMLEPIYDLPSGGGDIGLPPLPNVGGKTVNDNRSVTNNVNVTVNGADVSGDNLKYTLVNELNSMNNLNEISNYAQQNRDDL